MRRNAGRWWEWHQVALRRLQSTWRITFAFVATHNHFALDPGGVVFKQSAPVFLLEPCSDESMHIRLLGLLNSSTACFWLKQVAHNKGDSTDANGARVTGDPAFDTYEFTATKIAAFPVAQDGPTEIARRLDDWRSNDSGAFHRRSRPVCRFPGKSLIRFEHRATNYYRG